MDNVENVSVEELQARLAAAEAENNKLRRVPDLGASEKGCVMVKNIRRFPISLYPQEWETIFEMKDDILQFIADHPELPRK